MSNLDPASTLTDKPKRKNDEDSEARYRRRRNLFRGMLVAAILTMFAILYTLHSSEVMLDGSTAPVIDAVDYHREYVRDATNTSGKIIVHVTIQYHDREGDVSTLEIEAGQTGKNWSWIHSGDENAPPSVQRRGAVRTTWFECAGHGLDLTINFIDQLGNRSNTIDETVTCFDPELVPTIQFQATGTASAKSQE